MDRFAVYAFLSAAFLSAGLGTAFPASEKTGEPDRAAQPEKAAETLSGFADWRADRPGLRHRILIEDLPPPYEHPLRQQSAPRSGTPSGREAQRAGRVLGKPFRRRPRSAPHAAHRAERRHLRGRDGGGKRARAEAERRRSSAAKTVTFASGLSAPFGSRFIRQGPNPQWVYVAEEEPRLALSLIANGDIQPRSAPEVVVAETAPTTGGHVTRDVAFSNDGARMFVSVGSQPNDAEGMPEAPRDIGRWRPRHGVGAALGPRKAAPTCSPSIPEGKDGRVFATGLRNCVGPCRRSADRRPLLLDNERDGLGDNLVPDYVDAGPRRRLFRLAVALYGRSRRPAPERRAAGPRGKVIPTCCSSRTRPRSHDLLYGDRFPARVSRRGLRRLSRLMEPRQTHRLQGCARDHAGGPTGGRI